MAGLASRIKTKLGSMLFKTKTGADEAEDLPKKKKKKGLESGVRSGAYTKASGYKKLLKEAGEY